jgi:hypothetical protein
MRLLLPLLCLIAAAPGPAQVIITEFMADNTQSLADEDGGFNDWIELHNPGAESVSMDGWALTDNAASLQKWTFPDGVTIPSRGYLLVWASEKNRRVPGQPLHTNFKLSAGGEYLALVKPDLAAATEFSPAYPSQIPDRSFGPAAETTVTIPVQQGSAGKFHVPASDALGNSWTGAGFNHAAWTDVVNGIGYETGGPAGSGWTAAVLADAPTGFYRLEETGGSTAANEGTAGAAAAGAFTGTYSLGVAGPRPTAFSGMASDNKALGLGGAGYVQMPYSAAHNPSVFTVECWARATGGAGTFRAAVSNRDDTGAGGQTKGYIFYAASNNTWQFWTGSGGSGAWDPVAGPPVVLNQWVHLAGTYDGAVKRFYVNGVQVGTGATSAFNVNTARGLRIGGGQNEGAVNFRFVGDVDEVAIYSRAFSAAEISARHALATTDPSLAPFITTSVQTALQNVNASGYYRLPFTVTDASAIDAMTLKMKYDDGFQAYLNGVAVAGGNVPPVLTWNSAASEASSNADAISFESFSLNSALNSLQNGTNILAIHTLNASASDSDQLQLAQLELTDVGAYSTNPVYLNTATPGSVNSNGATTPGPSITGEAFTPAAPTVNDDITVTCRVHPVFAPVATLTLNWRTAYNAVQQTAMTDDGNGGDATAADGIYTAVIPKTAAGYTQGGIVRWFFTATDTGGNASRWPIFTAGDESREYFGTMLAATGFTTQLPVWHWFAQNTAAAATRSGTRGQVFFNGQLYDNIFIRLRGGFTSTGSKKFDFNTGDHCRINDNIGRVEEANINGAGSAESILRPPVSFEMHRRAGNPSSECFPVLIRVNGTLDTGTGRGGIGYFVEQVDERYLDRHGFDRDGALYKPDQRANLEPVFTDATDGVEKKTRLFENRSDYQSLVEAVHSISPDDWNSASPNTPPVFPAGFTATRTTKLFDMLNMANLVNYLAVRVIISDTDDTRKNFYWYRDTEGSGEWYVFPWDKDYTLGVSADATPWVGHPFQGDYAHRKVNGSHQWNYIWEAAFNEPKIRDMVLRRQRTLMDTLLGSAPGAPEALADAIWAPMVATTPLPASFSGATNNSVKNFFTTRRSGPLSTSTSSGLFSVYAAPNGIAPGVQIPAAQPANAVVNFGTIDYLPVSGNQDEEFVQISNPNSYAVDISGWELKRGIEHKFEYGTVVRGNDVLYVAARKTAFRARAASPKGGEQLLIQGGYKGTISARGEIVELWDPMNPASTIDDRLVATLNTPATPTPAQQGLRVTEIMYDPPAGGSFAAGDYEFIELMNISATPLDLTGTAFDEGITFTFGALTMAPGQRIVLVRNPAAFAERYPAAPAPAGTYTGALDNSGERIRIVDARGEEVLDFRYEGTWYANSHGGSSLVIEDVNAAWDTWENQSAWRTSAAVFGNPGAADPSLTAPVITGVTGATIHLLGAAGRTYLLQRSFDFSTWTDVNYTTAPAAAFDVTDPAANQRALYRVRAK